MATTRIMPLHIGKGRMNTPPPDGHLNRPSQTP